MQQSCILIIFPYLYNMNFKVNWDALGISASLACAIHCALLPLMLNSLPILGVNIIDNITFEWFMIVLAAGIGIFSLWHGYKLHHHSFRPLALFGIGMSLLVAKQIWHQFQIPLLIVAVAFIVIAHIKNYSSCRVHNHAHAEDCDH